MKTVCQKCKAERLFETGPAALSNGFACAHCAADLDCVLWSGNEPTTLSLSTQMAVKGKSYTVNHDEMADTKPELSNEHVALVQTIEDSNQQDTESDSSSNATPEFLDDLGITSQDIVLTTDFDRARQRLATLQEQQLTEDALAGESSVAPNINALRSTRMAVSDYENSSLGVRLLPVSPIALLGIALASLLLIFLLDTRARQQKQALPLIPVTQAQSSQTSKPEQQPAPAQVETNNTQQPAQAGSPSPTQPVTETSIAPVNQEPVSFVQPDVELKKEESKTVAANNAPVQTDGRFTIQVGSFPDQAQAQERINKLSSNGIEARAVKTEIPKRGTWYRVQLGRFESREEAARFGSQLRGKGAIQDFVIAEITE